MTDSTPKTPSLQLTTDNFALVMRPVETSHNIMPAVRFKITCTLTHPTGTFSYQADDIWIDFEALDQFIGELGNLVNHSQGAATLICLAKVFKFELLRQDEIIEANIYIVEHKLQDHHTRLSSTFYVADPELVSTWYRNFSEFRR